MKYLRFLRLFFDLWGGDWHGENICFSAAFDVAYMIHLEKPKNFKCNGCGCVVGNGYSVRTEGYCYLCDPAVTVNELLSDKPIAPF